MIELILGVLLAAGAAYFVLLPVLRPPVATARDAPGGDEGDDPDEDVRPQAVALRAIKEIEFDRATGKLSDADYEQLKTKYTAEALAAMRGEQGTGSTEQKQIVNPVPPARPLLPALSCPEHGPRAESEAVFCAKCGRRLGAALGYCLRCGTALETDARFCNRCGARVAA